MSEQNEKLNKKRHFKPLPLKVYLLYLIVATLIFTGVTLSRYSAEITASDTARVAVAVAQMWETEDAEDVLDANAADDDYRYKLSVSNKNGDLTAEVTLTYTIHVTIVGPYPNMTASLTDAKYIDGDQEPADSVTIAASDGGGTELIFKTTNMLPPGVQQTNQHILILKPTGEKRKCMKFNIEVWAQIDQVD